MIAELEEVEKNQLTDLNQNLKSKNNAMVDFNTLVNKKLDESVLDDSKASLTSKNSKKSILKKVKMDENIVNSKKSKKRMTREQRSAKKAQSEREKQLLQQLEYGGPVVHDFTLESESG